MVTDYPVKNLTHSTKDQKQSPDNKLKTENQHTEFKSSFNETTIETLCAFVNTKGGKVHIGLDDKGNPVPNFFIGKETIAN
ncbi:ATP-binding protein [Flavobacterium sp. RSP15]|nr:ATP-binding protein [Flavobacterium sp. RSP15]